MFEVLLGISLGLLLASNAALWLKLNTCYSSLTKLIQASNDLTIDVPNLEDIREEISNTIEDFMGNLHVPTAQDHFIGGLSQIMQMWAMKKFQPMVEQMQNQLSPAQEYVQPEWPSENQ
jgi:hypothetical protein